MTSGQGGAQVESETIHRLAEECARLRRLLELSPAVIYSLRVEGGALVPEVVSGDASRLLGYGHEEMRDPAWFAEHVHPDDREAVLAATLRLLAEDCLVHEYRFRHAEGGYRWIRDEMRLVRDASRRPMEAIGSWLDVTDSKQAEEALRRSEERLRTIIETEPECVKVIGPDGRLLEMNPSGLAMLEAGSLEEVQRVGMGGFVVPGSRSAFAGLIAGAMRGESGTLQYEIVGLRGTQRWLETNAVPLRDSQGGVAGVLGVTRDVTGPRRAAEALAASEERFRALIERSTDLIMVFDAAGKVAFLSPSVSEALGYPMEELLVGNAFDYMDPEDRPEVGRVMRELAAEPGATRRFELHARRSDGSWRLFEAVARNLLDVPVVRGIVVNSRDITDQKRLEEQFFQAQKLESIGRLAGGVAHDFNNLLIGVLGYADFLEEGIREGKPSLEDLAEIRKAGERARDLTRQLLAVARRQVILPRVIDVNALVRDSEKLLQRVMGEDVAIDVRLAEGLRPVKADSGQLQQVILNLAVNARDAMPKGGRFRVETAEVEVGGRRAPLDPGVEPGRWVTLTVSDNGQGMGPEIQAHLFEPFFTTKPAGQGTGLGLATVYGIVKQSGGHIGFHSAAGAGTTFRIWLPATGEEAPEPRKAVERPARPERPVSGTILVVEDATAVRDLAVRTLREAGYVVLEASSGRQAIEVAERAPGPIRLLLADVVMPEMNGRTVAERLAAWHPGLRVLYMSGYARDAIAQHGVLEPGTEFLAKPFTPTALLARVRAVLDAI